MEGNEHEHETNIQRNRDVLERTEKEIYSELYNNKIIKIYLINGFRYTAKIKDFLDDGITIVDKFGSNSFIRYDSIKIVTEKRGAN